MRACDAAAMIRMPIVVATVLSAVLPASQCLAGRGESLLQAVERGDTTRAVSLLDRGAESDFKGWRKNRAVTPLTIAIERSDRSMVKLLLDRRASPGAQGGMALDAAIDIADEWIVRLLRKCNGHFNGDHLSKALETGHVDIARVLIEDDSLCTEKADYVLAVLTGVPSCEKALWSACVTSNFDLVDRLLVRGANGAHAMQEAAAQEKFGLVDTLLAHGVDPNATCVVQQPLSKEELGASNARSGYSFHTNTILASMVATGNTQAARMLLDHGANPAGDPRYDISPLQIAEARRDSIMTALLMERLLRSGKK